MLGIKKSRNFVCSHIAELSLDLIKDVILHLLVLAVARVRAIEDAGAVLVLAHTLAMLVQSLLQARVQLVSDLSSGHLLSLELELVLLDGLVQALRGLICLPLDEALFQLGWTEERETDFCARLLTAVILCISLDLLKLLAAVSLRGKSLLFIVLEHEKVLLLLFSREVMR